MGWLNWWPRRKQLYINGSSTAQTNYQMRITVNYGSGTDSAGNIYCKSQVRSDFGDIRFTSSDGVTLLNYWIESYVSGSNAVIWVNVASIPTGTSYIYMYYNNLSMTTVSNGDATLIFMDDFSGSSYTNKWTLRSLQSYSSITESGGTLTQSVSGAGGSGSLAGGSISSYIGGNNINIGNGIELHVKIVSATSNSNWNRYSIDFGTGTRTEAYGTCGGATVPNDGYAFFMNPPTWNQLTIYRVDNGTKTQLGATVSLDPNGKYLKMTYLAPNIYVYYSTDNINWTQLITTAGASIPAKSAGPLFLAEYSCGDRGGSIVYDYLFVINFTSPEPAWSSIGAEEWLNSFFNAGD